MEKNPLTMGEKLLKLMSAFEPDDRDLDALRDLKGVRVKAYSTEGEQAPAKERFSEVKKELQRQQWELIVQVRERNEDVQIFVKANEDKIHGLMIMAVEGKEVWFVNLIGDMDPSRWRVVIRALDAM